MRPEFVRKDSQVPASALIESYAYLGYDLGVATASEARWVEESGSKLPSSWRTLGPKPVVAEIAAEGLQLGIILFPQTAPLTPELEAEVRKAADALRRKGDMVVGVSSWGEDPEKAFLEGNGGVVDLLLGSGRAHGRGLRVSPDGKTLWIRPSFDGWGVSKLDVLARPASGGAWKEGRDYSFTLQWLDGQFSEEPNLASKLSWY